MEEDRMQGEREVDREGKGMRGKEGKLVGMQNTWKNVI